MIQLLENIYALNIPEFKSFDSIDYGNMLWYNDDKNNIRKYGITSMLGFKYLGTVTKYTIDFDIEPITPELYFRSLLTSKGILFENPLGKKPNFDSALQPDPEHAMKFIDDWENAQQNVIDKLVIIKKL
jgi:hypothetical protein